MNKWQIICPVSLMVIVGVCFGIVFSRNQANGFTQVVESCLESVLKELKGHPDGGRFPSLDSARSILNDEVVKDVFYNPRQPALASDADVICAHFGGRLFMIRADGKVRQISESELRQIGLVSLCSATRRATNWANGHRERD
jgi:hypothetical protein